MRLSRLPAVLVAGALLSGIVSCAATVEGTGTLASDVVVTGAPTGSPGTSGSAPQPTTASPTPAPTTPRPTIDPVTTKRRLLCVLERAAIATINSQFNKSKNRDAQIRVLRTGSTTIRGHIERSGLPAADGVRQTGQSVLNQLNQLVKNATAGQTPSTRPYNVATQTFQRVCNTVS
jgi:hypothetical protein